MQEERWCSKSSGTHAIHSRFVHDDLKAQLLPVSESLRCHHSLIGWEVTSVNKQSITWHRTLIQTILHYWLIYLMICKPVWTGILTSRSGYKNSQVFGKIIHPSSIEHRASANRLVFFLSKSVSTDMGGYTDQFEYTKPLLPKGKLLLLLFLLLPLLLLDCLILFLFVCLKFYFMIF